MAEPDYDCRPPGVRPTASGSESSNRFCGFSHPTFFYGPSILASACSFARRCGAGGQRPRIQARWRLCNPIASAPGYAPAKKNAVQQAFTKWRFAPRSGTHVEQLDYLDDA
jgi:hypothetical protein